MYKLRLQIGMVLGALFAIVLTVFAPQVFSAVSNRISTNNPREVNTYSFFSATTTSATSTNLVAGGGFFTIAGAKKVTFQFTHGGAATTSTGTSTFNVQVSADGSTWYNFNKLFQNLATSTDRTSVASIGITGATSTILASMDLSSDVFYAVRCEVNEGTPAASGDGEHTCVAQAEF